MYVYYLNEQLARDLQTEMRNNALRNRRFVKARRALRKLAGTK